MKRHLTAAAALLLAGAATLAGTQLAAAPSSAEIAGAQAPAIGAAQARQIALTRAAGAGDAAPAVSVAREDLGEADTAMQAPAAAALAAPATPVYVVTMHGRFVLSLAHVPRGFPAPEGELMQLTIDGSGAVVGLRLARGS